MTLRPHSAGTNMLNNQPVAIKFVRVHTPHDYPGTL